MADYNDNYAQAMERAAMFAAPVRTQDNYLTPTEQAIIGRGVRIEIPIHRLNAHQLGKVAEMLHGIANAIAFVGQRADLTPAQRLFDAKLACMRANAEMKRMVGK